MRQRQTWNLRHHHRIRRILCHPDRELRQGAVGLTDGHSDIVTTAIATGYDDRLPVTGMKSVTDNRLAQLIVSIMKLSRRDCRRPIVSPMRPHSLTTDRLMGKRSNFERREADFYPTPRAAVLPLIPHL